MGVVRHTEGLLPGLPWCEQGVKWMLLCTLRSPVRMGAVHLCSCGGWGILRDS